MPPAADRAPASEEPFWPDKEEIPSATELRSRNVRLRLRATNARSGSKAVISIIEWVGSD